MLNCHLEVRDYTMKSRGRLAGLAIVIVALSVIFGTCPGVAAQGSGLRELEKKFQKEYAAVQKEFANGPENGPYTRPYTTRPDDDTLKRIAAERRERVGKWQDKLAARFARAAATAEEIIKLNPPNVEVWREHKDTLLLYSQPISSPETRAVFGDGEVQQQARLFKKPLADYPGEAQAAKANGEVRLRLVLAADGTIKYIFPTKPSKHGLTEAAIAAARRIEFEPAIRNGHRASQFVSLVYKFEDGKSLPPYVPQTAF
jgi:TonB family protein